MRKILSKFQLEGFLYKIIEIFKVVKILNSNKINFNERKINRYMIRISGKN